MSKSKSVANEFLTNATRLLSISLIAFGIIQLLDALTTIVGLNLGLVETNGFSMWVLRMWGNLGLLAVKSGVAVISFFFAWIIPKNLRKLGKWEDWVSIGLFFGVLGGLILAAQPVVGNIVAIIQKVLG